MIDGKTLMYRDCIEQIRRVYNAYTNAIVVYTGTDEDNNQYIKFTIVEPKGE